MFSWCVFDKTGFSTNVADNNRPNCFLRSSLSYQKLKKPADSSPARPSFALESAIGFGVGFLGGMVGLVLGSIRMPAMISVLKMEPKVAVGTNLAASAIMGAAGLAGHLINSEVDFLVLAIMGSTAMLGAYIGARYTDRFSANTLKLLIGFVLVFVAVVMFLNAASLA
ncbi:MAG: hypothetical protein DA330_05330 [Nitrososphaera sp.]|nr:hypothetical protein [Nitrososphaera sp.]